MHRRSKIGIVVVAQAEPQRLLPLKGGGREGVAFGNTDSRDSRTGRTLLQPRIAEIDGHVTHSAAGWRPGKR
jgi:hypothetical protein